jgi:hypothetical protein
LIYFQIPHTLSIGLGKHLTNHLKSGYSLCFQGLNSIAYLSTSQAILPSKPGLKMDKPHSSLDSSSLWNPNTLLYGRLFQDGSLEGLLARHFTTNTMGIASFHSPWRSREANVNL